MSEGRSLASGWDPNDPYHLGPKTPDRHWEIVDDSESVELQATPHHHFDSAFAAGFAIGFAFGVFALVGVSLLR